ncbi:hypothetical protein FDH38_gp110 [Dinoroseobacter phage vB_DshS-R5C]|uniref:Uncharacterized protein n=1 Tax=Dinoroseobacter phage vB_DshS-R5C TaxID=1965368 RepID=A0A1V0DYB4_9CAUD|nr:hypothetical protein FDH38_gp110 [Dinoroseobacter phage vB_DshS-R5C]ARB06164.1 hypothetical protein vBDshSR5C_110 [Dinoroseobacter phage vB_DshS-R5C]
MATRLPKPLRELLEQLPTWSADMRSRHVKLVHESGAVITTSKTPSDVRSYRNALARCKRIEKELSDG